MTVSLYAYTLSQKLNRWRYLLAVQQRVQAVTRTLSLVHVGLCRRNMVFHERIHSKLLPVAELHANNGTLFFGAPCVQALHVVLILLS